MTIYKITCLANQRIYIGSSKRKYKRARWDEHKKELRRNRHWIKDFQEDWNRHGEEKFTFELLDESLSEADRITMMKESGALLYNRHDADGLSGPKNPMYGVKQSEATRKKMSENRPKKPVAMIHPENHRVLKTFISVADAHKQTGVNISNIANCARGRIKTSGGYIWKFI